VGVILSSVTRKMMRNDKLADLNHRTTKLNRPTNMDPSRISGPSVSWPGQPFGW
jgi:hypothetical protein